MVCRFSGTHESTQQVAHNADDDQSADSIKEPLVVVGKPLHAGILASGLQPSRCPDMWKTAHRVFPIIFFVPVAIVKKWKRFPPSFVKQERPKYRNIRITGHAPTKSG